MMNDYNDLTSLKLVDFGLSAQNFDNFEDSNYCGTYLYMAPEQIEKRLYSKEVDVWSVGIILYMLLNEGKHPFYTKGESKTLNATAETKDTLVSFSKIGRHYGSTLVEIEATVNTFNFTDDVLCTMTLILETST